MKLGSAVLADGATQHVEKLCDTRLLLLGGIALPPKQAGIQFFGQ